MLRRWVGVGWTPRRKVLWRSQFEPWKTVWQCELEKKTRRVFRNKFPVIYRLSFYKHFKIPGNFQPILGHEPIVSLWRKRHFFQKPSKRWRGFPPGGKFKYSGIAINSMLWMCVFVCVHTKPPRKCNLRLDPLHLRVAWKMEQSELVWWNVAREMQQRIATQPWQPWHGNPVRTCLVWSNGMRHHEISPFSRMAQWFPESIEHCLLASYFENVENDLIWPTCHYLCWAVLAAFCGSDI